MPPSLRESRVRSRRAARRRARDAATSCTRTTAAPCSKHQTVVASVASSRAVHGRRRRATRPRNDLRDVPTSSGTRRAPRAPGSAREQREVVLGRLREADARDRRGSTRASTPAATARVDPRAQLVADLAHDVVRSRASSLHRARRAARVHRDERRVRRRRRRASSSGSAVPPETSLTIAAPASSAAARDRRPSSCRCSPGRRPCAASARTTGSDPAQLLVGVDRIGAGPGRLAADVEHRRAGRGQLQAVGDRRRRGRDSVPPSEKESGVTLTTPISARRGRSATRRQEVRTATAGG